MLCALATLDYYQVSRPTEATRRTPSVIPEPTRCVARSVSRPRTYVTVRNGLVALSTHRTVTMVVSAWGAARWIQSTAKEETGSRDAAMSTVRRCRHTFDGGARALAY